MNCAEAGRVSEKRTTAMSRGLTISIGEGKPGAVTGSRLERTRCGSRAAFERIVCGTPWFRMRDALRFFAVFVGLDTAVG